MDNDDFEMDFQEHEEYNPRLGDELMSLVAELKIEAREYDNRDKYFTITPYYVYSTDDSCRKDNGLMATAHSAYCAGFLDEDREMEEVARGIFGVKKDLFPELILHAKDIKSMTDVELCALIRSKRFIMN